MDLEKLKLFEVTVLDDMDWETILLVGKSKEQIEQSIWDKESFYSCLSLVTAREITEVDGYKISVLPIS